MRELIAISVTYQAPHVLRQLQMEKVELQIGLGGELSPPSLLHG